MREPNRTYTDNLACLGVEKREEIIKAVDEWLDTLSVTAMPENEHIILKRIDLHFAVDGVEIIVSRDVKTERG